MIGPTVMLPEKRIDIRREVDVVVAGGGSAGVAAAVAAARAGASVILLERHGFLGGTMTATTLGGICGLYSLVDGVPVQMVEGFAEEVRARLETSGGSRGPLPWLQTASLPYDLFILKTVLEDLAKDRRLELLYQTRLTDVIVSDGVVSHVVVRGRGEPFAIRARSFVDCTGDAELCALAGGDTDYDPEHLQFPSAMFRMGGVDTTRAAEITRPEMHMLLERAVEDGYDLPRTAGGIYSVRDGIVHLNITKVKVDGAPPDPLDAGSLSAAEREGRRQVRTYLEVFRRYVPGYENAFVLDTGCELGLRETRRIRGDYVMTVEDVLEERRFDDAIGVNCWPVEDHGAGRRTKWIWLSPGGYCQIPFRALLPKGLRNVIVAGRNISATHDAQASLRVTANCFSMGQAAGIAAAYWGGDMCATDIAVLQQRLCAEGATLGDIPIRKGVVHG
ncbi:MAG: FAD-dependent oxidoreductase [Pseudorhodobacter sp.]